MGVKKTLSSFKTKLVPNINFDKGFTFIEMLIIIPIAILTIGVFVAAIVNMTGEVLAVRGTNALTYEIQTALNKIEQDVSLSGAYLATNNIDLTTNPYQGYDNSSTYNASATNFHNADVTNGTMIILNSYTTADNPLGTTRNIVYTSAQPNACGSSLISQNPPVMINIVYFIKDSTLWRRVIVPSYYETVGCVGTSVGIPWQQPSCALGISGTLCKTQDVRLVDNVKASDFTVNYYTGSDSTTANSVASDNSQTDSARSAALQTTNAIGISITAKTTIAGREISQSGSIRAVSPNNNRSLTVSTTSPSAPNSLAVVGGSHQETLTWAAPTNNGGHAITGYKIYRGNTSNSEILLIKVGNILTYTDTSLGSSATYYYKIAAINDIGEGVLSNEANGTTAALITVTFNPTGTGQTGTIQTWTVPSTGSYTIEVWGAQGGQGTNYTQYSNGKGARMKGTFSLTSGTALKILVGQQGPSGTNDGGGGGGTFVTDSSNNPLIIAGGGGGSSYNGAGVDAVTANTGTAGANGGTGGTNGLGGVSAGYAGGGGGLSGNGGYGTSGSTCTGGISFINNGNGGCTVSTTTGGFGGGGGTHGGGWGGGGGGGYSGGGASTSSQYGGGGGGSYNSGTDQSNTAGARASSGLVTITY